MIIPPPPSPSPPSPPPSLPHSLLTCPVLSRYYTHLKREMRTDFPLSSDIDAAAHQHHTFSFVSIDHVLMKRLQNVPDREFVQATCVLSVAPPPSASNAPARRLRVVLETNYPRTVRECVFALSNNVTLCSGATAASSGPYLENLREQVHRLMKGKRV